MSVVVVIPAYQPDHRLTSLIRALQSEFLGHIVVVDDGSTIPVAALFAGLEELEGVHVLRHAINLGKGAALRTGFNYALCNFPNLAGVVTADADGQHHYDDIRCIARRLREEPDTLVLGVRDFSGNVPLRSRVGNNLTRWIVSLIIGQRLADTQTGLRGIPRTLISRLTKVGTKGYAFELAMLITAKHNGFPFRQEPIQTIYEAGNRSSHFSPVRDSMRIYMVLFRFSILSAATAILDNIVFIAVFHFTGKIAIAQASGRIGAMLFNYQAARKAVFLSDEHHRSTLPKYALLVAVNGFVSYAMIGVLVSSLGFRVIEAKLTAESLLFAANFLIQRDLVFIHRRKAQATDWTAYYSNTPVTARFTRKYTSAVLIAMLLRYVKRDAKAPAIVEIGGANSCFLEAVLKNVRPRAYHVVDTNEYGLKLLHDRIADHAHVHLHRQDVRAMSLELEADAVFSVGLIEHFDTAGTRDAVLAHLALVRKGGFAILSYPTPTWLYRIARAITESLGLWAFPDERPLCLDELASSVAGHGSILFKKTLWPLVFTQQMIVIQKHN